MRLLTGLPLYWKICGINGAVFLLGTLVLVISPLSISSRILLSEVVVVSVGLVVMFVTNALLIRRHLAPLDRLERTLDGIEEGLPSDLPEEGSGPARGMARAVNDLLDRLEVAQRAGSAQVLAAQEAERRRIAQELHDEVGQSLTVVLLGLKQLSGRVPAELVDDLAEVRESTRASLDDVRRVASRLRPGPLEDLGLASALISLTTVFEQHSTATVRRSFVPNMPPISPESALVVYRVAQEALTNAARHADAHDVQLSITVEDQVLVLEVRDDGRGFLDLTEGSGLLGMRERAALVEADLTVSSRPRQGTTVRLRVPVHVAAS